MHYVAVSSGIVFFFKDTATTEIYTLSLHDALPISVRREREDVGDDAAEHERLRRLAQRVDQPVAPGAPAGDVPDGGQDRKSTRLNSSQPISRMPSSACKKNHN